MSRPSEEIWSELSYFAAWNWLPTDGQWTDVVSRLKRNGVSKPGTLAARPSRIRKNWVRPAYFLRPSDIHVDRSSVCVPTLSSLRRGITEDTCFHRLMSEADARAIRAASGLR
jgi:hypothetical protein